MLTSFQDGIKLMHFEIDITVHAAYMNGTDVSSYISLVPITLCYCKNVEMVLHVGQVLKLVYYTSVYF